MKRVFAFAFVVVLTFMATNAFADVPNVSGMTDDELRETIRIARDELLSREAESNDGTIVLYDRNGILVYLTRNNRVSAGGFLYMEIIAINNSDKDVFICADDYAEINGWQVTCIETGLGMVKANGKKCGECCYNAKDARMKVCEDLEDILFVLKINDGGHPLQTLDQEEIYLHFN